MKYTTRFIFRILLLFVVIAATYTDAIQGQIKNDKSTVVQTDRFKSGSVKTSQFMKNTFIDNIKFEELFDSSTVLEDWLVVNADGSPDDSASVTAWGPFINVTFGGTSNEVNPQAGAFFWFSSFQNANENQGGLIDEWLITPKIANIQTGDSLIFYVGAIDDSFDDSLMVLVSTTDSALASFTNQIAYFKATGPIGNWEEKKFDLSAFCGFDIFIAFRYYIVNGGLSGANSDNIWFDHVIITTPDGNPGNSVPVITNTSLVDATEGIAYNDTVVATDADNDTLTFSAFNVPAWMTVGADGALSGTPDTSDVGNGIAVEVQVTDSNDGCDAYTTSINVIGITVNNAPVISTTSLVDATEGVAYNDTVKATDIDNDILSFSAINVPAWMTVGSDGALSGTPGTSDVGNSIAVELQVFDGNGGSDTLITTIDVVAIVTGVNDRYGVPDRYYLHQNHPNPFNPETTIEYDLQVRSKISIIVYDLAGREIVTLVHGIKEADNHRVTFSPGRLSSGLYLYSLRTDNFIQTRKMILLK